MRIFWKRDKGYEMRIFWKRDKEHRGTTRKVVISTRVKYPCVLTFQWL